MKLQPLERDPDEPDAIDPDPLCDWIVSLFAEKLNIAVPSANADLMDTGVLDSLALVELLLHLEQQMGIKVSLENLELENFRSVATIAQFVARSNGRSHRIHSTSST